jgi:hypothetical protein
MEIAAIKDFELELWLRKRESGTLVWKTKQGDLIPIKNMSDTHIINTINLLQLKDEVNELACEYESEDF